MKLLGKRQENILNHHFHVENIPRHPKASLHLGLDLF